MKHDLKHEPDKVPGGFSSFCVSDSLLTIHILQDHMSLDIFCFLVAILRTQEGEKQYQI